MILNERDARHEHILQVARQMMTAARTAPKGKGIDIIEVALITDEEIKQLSDTMIAMVEEHGMKFFLRDADTVVADGEASEVSFARETHADVLHAFAVDGGIFQQVHDDLSDERRVHRDHQHLVRHLNGDIDAGEALCKLAD